MVRQASAQDAPQIARLIVLAMGRLAAKFANSDDTNTHVALFERFVRLPGNQYSYQNILVYEEGSNITGMIIGYDGGDLYKLRAAFLEYITRELGFTGQPEDETKSGEYYIDCLAVDPAHQGKGLAKALITAMIGHAVSLGHKKTGLLVSKENARAYKLYTEMGFEYRGELELLGGYHNHLQYQAKPAQ